MSSAADLYYKLPHDLDRERRLGEASAGFGGHIDSIQTTEIPKIAQSVCVTFEFPNPEDAEQFARACRGHGEHLEGPYGYAE